MTTAPAPDGVDRLVALGEYEGPVREQLLALKRGRGLSALPEMASLLASSLGADAGPGSGAVVTWVPTTRSRRRERGYDQSRLLARAVARRLKLPSRRLLTRRSGAQAGLGAGERRAGPAFAARRQVPASIVLIDDVMTTGASLDAAAKALRAGGAVRVVAGVVAWAPAPTSMCR